MDNREAINWLINISADIGKAKHSDLWHYEQALAEIKDMLESAQPVVTDINVGRKDLISRQEAIDIIEAERLTKLIDAETVVNGLKGLPSASAQPKQKWIPCGERLPEDSQFVLMTIRRMNKHYSHEPFISVGYISWNQSVWWCAHDGDCKSHDVRVDAWMPLPEPYRNAEQRWKGY